MNFARIFRTVTAAGILSAGVAFAQPATTLHGVVTDKMCGLKHTMMPGGAKQCTRECVKNGSPYALAVGDKIYTLQGHDAELYKLAGEKATVKGTVTGVNVRVSWVGAAK